MSTEASPLEGGAARRVAYATSIYVGVVAAAGVCLTAAAIRLDGIDVNATLLALSLLAVLAWLFGSVDIDNGRISLSFHSIVLLAAVALVGPGGAGIVALVMGPLQEAGTPLRARIFNTGTRAIMGVVGGYAYIFAGGEPDGGHDVVGTWQILLLIGIPVLVADLVQFALNVVLVAVVVRLATGTPMRSQMRQIVGGIGPAYVGYGIIAFIMVVLWGPANLGSASVFLILPPLVVAQWAYRQYSEEVKGHERALEVLVAAVEAKAPHLVGHSTRVADLSEAMAEHLGLRTQAIADARIAGMLHDLGLTTLPTSLVRSTGVAGEGGLGGYPARGVRLLTGLSFLSGALDAIAHHRDAVSSVKASDDSLGVAALIVGLADEYDLLTEVGTPDGQLFTSEEAFTLLRQTPAGREDLLRALEHALSRRTGTVSA